MLRTPRTALLLALALAPIAPAAVAQPAPAPPAADARNLLQLIDYVGVDYAGAVAGGQVIHAGEYAEMVEFARRIRDGVATLGGSEALADDAEALVGSVARKGPPEQVAALTRRMERELMRVHPVPVAPRRAPDLARGALLFRQTCATCHGLEGRGDGPSAATLDPPPTDFHDLERAHQRSLYGLYNTITLGVAGTGMASFADLPDEDRWPLAFSVGGLYADGPTLARGEREWDSGGGVALHQAVTAPPVALAAAHGPALAAWSRRHPELLFRAEPDPIDVAQARLAESAAAYAAGDRAAAQTLALAAYLEGFELAEAGLGTVAPEVVREVEGAMMGYRAALDAGAPDADVQERAREIDALLGGARRALDEGALSGGVAFTSAAVILLREGLEAMLLLGAILAFLRKTERREAVRWVHYGWIAALALGIATWVAATWLLRIGGAAREVTEGVTALVAAGILFYVGFWMHDKLSAQRWNAFLREQMQRALERRTLLGIASISFVAVYREVFETVLFYQALWAQVADDGHGAVLGGAGAAAVALALLGWAIFRFGLKLPLRQFFAGSAAAMFVLAVVFAGKGVMALQEAGKLPISPVSFPRIELLGIYPTWQSLAAQLLLVLAALSLVGIHRVWARAPQGQPRQAP